MWSPDETPTLSLEQFAKIRGKSVRETKGDMEEYWRLKQGRALQIEKKAAEIRHKRGPARISEALDGAFPQIAMSKTRFIELYRASKMEKGCKGGELLGEESDFTQWLLKRDDMEHLRVKLAKTTNKVGWMPTVAANRQARLDNAFDYGKRERAGRAILDPSTGGWLP